MTRVVDLWPSAPPARWNVTKNARTSVDRRAIVTAVHAQSHDASIATMVAAVLDAVPADQGVTISTVGHVNPAGGDLRLVVLLESTKP
jgi:hypothetical protein